LVDYTTGTLYLDNVVGGFVQSESISSQTYNATSIQTVYTDFKPLTAVVYGAGDVEKSSGRLFYISNREKISRVSNQQEDLIAILSF
jgi:predicted secreted acid phosphatase